jgi:ATP-dependent RNA helicase RhlE
MTKTSTTNHAGFVNLGIKDSILAVLQKMGLENPTPIQIKAIPVALDNQDLIGIAQTGTGKTFAFGIPMLHILADKKGRALVVLPTRELAGQVEENLHRLGNSFGLRTVCLIGGEPIGKQLYALRKKPHVLVATPGRLLDHIKRKSIVLDDISVLVLDEADMMFDLGFAPQIEEIMKLTPKGRQVMLFSATMPDSIMRLVSRHLRQPVHIEVAPAGTTADLVDQEIYLVSRDDKLTYLEKLLDEYKGTVLVFVRTKHGAANLTEKLKRDGYKAAEIHSNLSFNQRKNALAGFKSGLHRILVATDVAARGLDINDIELVVNYDLPDNSEDYVHRIGRTARAGKTGKAISFAVPSQKMEVKKIERLIKKELPYKKMARLATEPDRDYVEAPARQSYPSRNQSSPIRKKMVTYGQDSNNRGGSYKQNKSSHSQSPARGQYSDNSRYKNNQSAPTVRAKNPHVSTQPDFSDLPSYLAPKAGFIKSDSERSGRSNFSRSNSSRSGSARPNFSKPGSSRASSGKYIYGKSGFEKKDSNNSIFSPARFEKPSFKKFAPKSTAGKTSFGSASFEKRKTKNSSIKHYK